ncbi:hypothetical protein FPQ18DRAFT_339190 [Pyronema domesticum]|nr:hypothetical protein FPQ18DRAFT_339190 [Pyronema domesticum]
MKSESKSESGVERAVWMLLWDGVLCFLVSSCVIPLVLVFMFVVFLFPYMHWYPVPRVYSFLFGLERWVLFSFERLLCFIYRLIRVYKV